MYCTYMLELFCISCCRSAIVQSLSPGVSISASVGRCQVSHQTGERATCFCLFILIRMLIWRMRLNSYCVVRLKMCCVFVVAVWSWKKLLHTIVQCFYFIWLANFFPKVLSLSLTKASLNNRSSKLLMLYSVYLNKYFKPRHPFIFFHWDNP